MKENHLFFAFRKGNKIGTFSTQVGRFLTDFYRCGVIEAGWCFVWNFISPTKARITNDTIIYVNICYVNNDVNICNIYVFARH